MQVPLLNALKTFTVSAQRLNFTKASEDLLVSPSAIGHQPSNQNLGRVFGV